MENKILIISGTPIISGAEYVLGDYLKDNRNINRMDILHSDIDDVNKFYNDFNFSNNYKSKYLNPVGVIGKNKINLIKKVWNLFLSFFIFYKIFRDKKIKKVLGNNTGDTIYAFYSYIFGKKHINYIHDMIEKDSLTAKSILFFDKFIFKYIAVSHAVKNDLINIGISEKKIDVIYNSLEYNPKFELKKIEDRIVFGFVGTIDDRKNPLEFLKFIEIAQKHLKKDVIGRMVFGNILDEKLFYEIKEYIQNKKLNVELLGKKDRKDMLNFYNEIHFFVLTSRRDPLPTVILEAFNFAIPVIAHNVDGIPEMVIDEKNGFLYDSEKDFKMLVLKLTRLNYGEFQKNANNSIKEQFDRSIKKFKLDKIIG